MDGRGSGLRISLFDVAAEWMTVPLVQHEYGSGGPTRVGLHHPSIAPYGAYATDDGGLTLISIQNDREWVRLCTDVLDRPDLAADPRFATNNLRVEHRADLDAALDRVVGAMSRAGFQDRLGAAAIAYGSVNSLEDLAAHPALRRRPVTASGGETVQLPAHPVRRTAPQDGAGLAAAGPPPEPPRVPVVGADTDRIRAEFGG